MAGFNVKSFVSLCLTPSLFLLPCPLLSYLNLEVCLRRETVNRHSEG